MSACGPDDEVAGVAKPGSDANPSIKTSRMQNDPILNRAAVRARGRTLPEHMCKVRVRYMTSTGSQMSRLEEDIRGEYSSLAGDHQRRAQRKGIRGLRECRWDNA